MTSPDTGRAGEVRAVRTNGIGKRTTAHLNLSRSLADVDWHGADHPTRILSEERPPKPALKGRPRGPVEPTRFQYAGAE
jgi:hypothetical protein